MQLLSNSYQNIYVNTHMHTQKQKYQKTKEMRTEGERTAKFSD